MASSSNVRPRRSAPLRGLRSGLVGALSVLLCAGGAVAGDECQEIQLDGIAGGTGSTVTIRVVDASPEGMTPGVGDIISTSCTLTVPQSEPAATFIRRIPLLWGNGLGGNPDDDPVNCNRKCTAGRPPTTDCTSNSQCDLFNHDGLGVCGVQDKKKCGNTTAVPRSCTIEAKVTQVKGKCDSGSSAGKSCSSNIQCPGGTCPGWDVLRSCEDADDNETCTKKRSLKICCKAAPDCSGGKLGGDGDNIPITVQTQITDAEPGCPGNAWCPLDVPGTNTQALRFKSDPIDGRPGPYGVQRECRASLQSATGAVTQAVFNVLKDCHRKVMDNNLPVGSCTSVNAVSDPGNLVAAASAALHAALNEDCQTSGKAPSDFGYTNCPAPCGAIDLAVCSAPAGMVGNPCQRNRNCDTSAGSGDGVCGNWNDVADCAVCGASAAGQAAIVAAYGSTGPDSTVGDAEGCQNHIGDGIASLLTVELKDAAACQKSLDRFKIMLSDRTPKCKDADHKRKRAKARAQVAADLSVACDNVKLAQLDTCATKMNGLADCIPRIARRVTSAVSDAGAPEGRCGDGHRGIGEKCDDGNVVDGDGCDSDCSLTGCGNGIVTGGEECDDGNQVTGDGCAPGCIAEPCGPQVCGAYTFDCSTNFPGDCVCLQAAEGQGTCVSNFNCATATPCTSSLQCASNERCYLQTCCGPPGTGVCGPKGCSAQ